MQPVLLRIGGLTVYAYDTFIGLGLLTGVWVSRREARGRWISGRRISGMWEDER